MKILNSVHWVVLENFLVSNANKFCDQSIVTERVHSSGKR